LAKLFPKLLILMPFGVKSVSTETGSITVDFEAIFKALITNVAQELGYTVVRMDEVTTPGRSSDQLLSELSEASVVVVDISASNPNVYYELGVCQAIATSSIVLIAQKGAILPYVIGDQRVFLYELNFDEQIADSCQRLRQTLNDLIEKPGDNPVQSFLQKRGVRPDPIKEMENLERDIFGRIERARNVLQLVAVWGDIQAHKTLPPRPLIVLAERLANEKEWALATEVIKAALVMRPNDYEFHRQLAWYLRKQGTRFDEESEKSFRKAFELNPKDPETLGMLGGLLKRQERFPEAAFFYGLGEQVLPNAFYLKVNLAAAELLANPQEPERAIKRYSDLALELEKPDSQPDDHWKEFTLGEAHFVLGNEEKAKEHFIKGGKLLSDPKKIESPIEQFYLFGKKGFRTEESYSFAKWLESLKIELTPKNNLDDSMTYLKFETPKNPPILLHLSDIHFGPINTPEGSTNSHRYNPSDYLKSLEDYLVKDFYSPQKHFNIGDSRLYLVVTGDITNTAATNEFDRAREFLKAICKKLNIPKKRVIICPGNHDVDWNIAKVDKTKRLDNYVAFLERFYGKELFSEICPAFKNLEYGESLAPHHITSYQTFAEDNLLFLSLNSCMYETSEYHYGFVGNQQFENYQDVSNAENASHAWVRIAIMHHHLHPFPEQFEPNEDKAHWQDQSTIRDSALVEKNLEKHRFDIVLHGHKHKPQIRQTILRDCFVQDDTDPLIVCGGGSCGADKKDLPPGFPNHYQVLKILQTPRRKDKPFVNIEWREHAINTGAEWNTPRIWELRG